MASAPPNAPDRRPSWIAAHLGRGRAFRRLKDGEQKTVVRAFTRIVDYWLDAAEGEAPTTELIDAVGFPGFVADLIEGVFDAIVDASTRQMKAYRDLLEGAAKTVDQFVEDNVTDDHARDYLIDTFPDVFADARDKGRMVKRRGGAAKSRWRLA